MRTLSARTFETLLDESNVRENEVRTRPANEPRYAPNARFLVRNEPFAFPAEPWHPKNARGVASSTHAAQPERHTWRIFGIERFFVFRTRFDSAKKRFRAIARGNALDRSFPRSFPRSVCCAPLRLETPRIVIDHARELTITRAPERRARRNGRRSRICRRCRAT